MAHFASAAAQRNRFERTFSASSSSFRTTNNVVKLPFPLRMNIESCVLRSHSSMGERMEEKKNQKKKLS